MNASDSHWSEDELIEHAYGLKAADQHLDSCAECSQRARTVAEARAAITDEPEVSYEFLAAQRRKIHQRLGSPLNSWHPFRWAVPIVAMLALVLGLTLWRSPERAHARDDQFYAEISAMAQSSTPAAVQPIEALVQDDASE